MAEKIKHNECQVHCIQSMSEAIGTVGALRQRLNRLRRIVNRRWRYLFNLFSKFNRKISNTSFNEAKDSKAGNLNPGNWVRVRSEEEIRSNLNTWNQLKGCSFMEEMWPYCGTKQQVFKRVEKFLDERDYLMKRCKGIVLLEGVICEGTKDFGTCDRSCYYFWREEWLERLDEQS